MQYPPSWTYYRSCVWFLQELLIFAIGARVFWKRPDDDSAKLFFAVCIVTVGAFMGGYHWTEIVTEPLLIYPFALFAVFVPVVNLHFFLVFPEPIPFFERRRRWVLGGLYGIPTAYLLALWGSMYAARWSAIQRRLLADRCGLSGVALARLGYIALAVFLFGLCILCLMYSYRNARYACRAQPGAVDLAGLADLAGVDRLFAGAGVDRSRDAWAGATPPGRCSAFRSCTRWPMPSASPATS